VFRTVILCLLLAASTAWVYSDSLRFDFVSYDDPDYVLDNSSVAQGISRGGLRYALLSTDMGNWQPLNWLSYMLDYELYGLRAGGYHATNLILHVLNTLLLFLILRGMTSPPHSSASTPCTSNRSRGLPSGRTCSAHFSRCSRWQPTPPTRSGPRARVTWPSSFASCWASWPSPCS